MLLIFGLLIFLLLACLSLLMPAFWARQIQHDYADPRPVNCPETNQQVAVTIDAAHAAATMLREKPEFRLADCTRWPERAHCPQACLPQALRNEPYTKGEVHPSKTSRPIYHLPVLLAAFAAWYIGLLWHSHFFFRGRWGEALGLAPAEVKQLVMWYSPHILSVAACLLFAYGVAWLHIWFKRKGLWHGLLSSTLLWLALFLVSLPSMTGLPRSLLVIEISYTLIAAVVVGAIIGGLSRKLVMAPTTAAKWRHSADVA